MKIPKRIKNQQRKSPNIKNCTDMSRPFRGLCLWLRDL